MFVIKMYRVILVKLLAALENTAQVKRAGSSYCQDRAAELVSRSNALDPQATEYEAQAAALRPLLGK